jgi:hypothetical protein
MENALREASLPSKAEEVLRKFFNEMSTFMINQSESGISQRGATRRGGARPYPRYVRLILHEENWLPLIWLFKTFTQSRKRSATDALLQSIDLAVKAERLGTDGACFRLMTLRSNWHHRALVANARLRTFRVPRLLVDKRFSRTLTSCIPARANASHSLSRRCCFSSTV